MADQTQPDPGRTHGRKLGGIVHTYLGYDPVKFPSPTTPPPDVAGAAMEHMLRYGSTRDLTPEELAEAVEIDPSQIAGLGPSLDALIEMLLERKRKILETYETTAARRAALDAFRKQGEAIDPPKELRSEFRQALSSGVIRHLTALWYSAERAYPKFASQLLRLRETLGERYEVEQLAAKYDFVGREEMTVEKALEVKEELEEIDRLLEQLREARKNAKVGLVDMEALRRFADEANVGELEGMRRRVEEYLRQQAELQGVEQAAEGFRLGPRAYALFQGRILEEIFGNMQAARSGRHTGPIEGEGAVELPSTRGYEFGDSVTHMDAPQSFINALLREAGERERTGEAGADSARQAGRVNLRPEDIEIHRTRNNPKCATCVLMDMSGSMRYGGLYVQAKKMALALDGLIKSEYPGDFLRFIEVYSIAKVRSAGEVATLLPKPVTIHDPVVRLRADLSDPTITEAMLPPHFTNIQHGMQLARQLLAAQDTPNRQIVLITDGLPTAHFEAEQLFLLYPPDPRTEDATMREAFACVRENITINIFLLPSWSQSEDDIQFAHRLAEPTKGRVFFTAGGDLDRYVLWDYVNQRKAIIG
ncbi:MAG: hypothetical protein JJU33_02140 [Phycisphaerales bacterium]|nr:hypothetical protein [Phycisphaerales bacterium]